MKNFLANLFKGEPVEFTEDDFQGKPCSSYECSSKHLVIAGVVVLVLMLVAVLL